MLFVAGTFLPPGSYNCLVYSPLRSSKWGIAGIRRRQLYDDGTLLFAVVPAARSVLPRSPAGKNKTEGSTTLGLLAAPLTGAPLPRLLFRRPWKNPRQRLMGRIKSLASADTTTF